MTAAPPAITQAEELSQSAGGFIDSIEATLAQLPAVEMPVRHHWLPGMYGREIFMSAGTIATSEEHLTEHPFIVLSGRVAVASENEGAVIYSGGTVGVTKPHTRRILTVLEDTRWITWHVRSDDETTPEQIGERILVKHVNPLLGADHPRVSQWKNPALCPPVEPGNIGIQPEQGNLTEII